MINCPTINSLFNFLKNQNLDKKKLNKFTYLADNYVGDDWKKYMVKNVNTYNRQLVIKNENIEILILTWLPGQESPIHGHPDNGCILKVLKGELNEEIYDNLQQNIDNVQSPINTNIHKNNSVSYMHNDKGYHKIKNNSAEIACSLHIYSPPNSTNFV